MPDFTPGEHVYWLRRGKELWENGDREGALDAFRMSIKEKQNYSNGWQALYEAQIALGKNKDAIETCRAAVKVKRKYQWFWYYLGNAYAANEDYKMAILAYERSLLLWKTYKKPMFGLIQIYRRLGNREKVKQYSELMTKPRKEILDLRKMLKIEWKQNKKKMN